MNNFIAKPEIPARPKQPTPKELTDSLMAFLQRKFYEGDVKEFNQDKRLLLKWVVLWPATWFNQRGVTVPAERYKEIFLKVFMQALQLRADDKIRYRPGYLRTVIQSHFAHHGEEYYNAAKSARNLAEHALLMVGRPAAAAAPDPVREMALANALIKPSRKGKKLPVKSPLNGQLNLV